MDRIDSYLGQDYSASLNDCDREIDDRIGVQLTDLGARSSTSSGGAQQDFRVTRTAFSAYGIDGN